MTRKLPIPAAKRAPVPAEAAELMAGFAPVPRRYRHDGWTPERQRAFIAALSDTGCVERAARMVNMAQANCYTLRRAPGADEFRRAWDAALDFGLKRLKDIAFERAIEGQLVPVFVGGKLIGFRRKRNDALLMFCLRHYGQDASGKRTTINYFSSRASAGTVSAVLRDGVSTGSTPHQDERIGSAGTVSAGPFADSGPPPPAFGRSPKLRPPVLACPPDRLRSSPPSRGGIAEASATTVRTVITGSGAGGAEDAGRLDAAAAVLEGFEGVRLDAEAEAAIAVALEACAARARATDSAYDQGGIAAADAAEDDAGQSFFRSTDYRGELVPAAAIEEFVPFAPGEAHWTLTGAEKHPELVRIEEELAAKAAAAVRDAGSTAPDRVGDPRDERERGKDRRSRRRRPR